MSRGVRILGITVFFIFFVACASSYKAKPLPFRAAASYANATEVAGATVGAEAFVSAKEAKQAFGFDVRGAGMLPVQVVFDNQGFQPPRDQRGSNFFGRFRGQSLACSGQQDSL